jgi:hypothetical protein
MLRRLPSGLVLLVALLGSASGSPMSSGAMSSSKIYPGNANGPTKKNPLSSFAFQPPLLHPALLTSRSVCHGVPVLASRKSLHSVGHMSPKKTKSVAKTYIRMESTGGSSAGGGAGSDDVPPLDARFDGWVEKSSEKAEMLEVGRTE